jgi:hypothetical protein
VTTPRSNGARPAREARTSRAGAVPPDSVVPEPVPDGRTGGADGRTSGADGRTGGADGRTSGADGRTGGADGVPGGTNGGGSLGIEGVDLLARLRNGAWLDRQDFPPLGYHVPGIIPEGSTLLVGPPKVGKSWLVLSVALAVASGGRVLGLEVERRPVLLLALEDGDRRLQERCRILLADGTPIPEDLEYLTEIEPMTVLATIAAWLDRQRPEVAPLVILDTLGKVMPPALMGESAYQRDYRVGSALKRLTDARPGTGLVVNHHDRKADSTDFVEKVSGTNGLAGSADTIVVLARDRHAIDGLLSVTGRDVPEGEYAVRFDGPSGLWTLHGTGLADAAAAAAERRTTDGLDDRARAIVAHATAHPEGVKAAGVAEAVGIDQAQARQYLARLVESGRLERAARGVYTPVASVALSRFADDQERDNATLATPLVGDDWNDQ